MPEGIGPPLAVVLDVDGTLYDAARMKRRYLWALALRCLAAPSTLRELRMVQVFRACREALPQGPGHGLEALQYAVPAERLGAAPEALHEAVRRYVYELPLPLVARSRRPGVRALFRGLAAAGVRRGVFSEYPAQAKLACLGLEAEAVAIATDPGVDCLKPGPEGLLKVLEMLDVDPGQALYVGDRMDKDGECARRAGVSFVLLASGRCAVPGGVRRVGSFAALGALLGLAPEAEEA